MYSEEQIDFCAWVLRETWGKRKRLIRSERERIEEYAKPSETHLAAVLRITGVKPPLEGADAAGHFRREAERVLLTLSPTLDD